MKNVTAQNITVIINHYHPPIPANEDTAQERKQSVWLNSITAIFNFLLRLWPGG